MDRKLQGLKWKPFEDISTGNFFDLSHLHPHIMDCDIPGSNNSQPLHLKVLVSYSIHCFTRRAYRNEQIDTDSLYSDSRESRIFCVERWEFSKCLPGIIETLHKRRCCHTDGEEFVTLKLEHDGKEIEYAVFFTVTKNKKSPFADLNLVVNTAHKRTKPLRHTKPIKFHVILAKRYRCLSIRTPNQ